MKKITLITLINFILCANACAQLKNDTVMIEKYNYEAVEGKPNGVSLKDGDWIIDIYPMPSGYQKEFAPAKDFYMIGKEYFDNGIMRLFCKFLGRVPFGKREIFDEEGKLIEVIDEDKKFGKIKPKDVVEIMEGIGLFNRETGENIIVKEILPTDGNFYKTIVHNMTILFIPAQFDEEDKQIGSSQWIVRYMAPYYIGVEYIIDGDTGKYTVERRRIGMIN